MCFSGFLYLLDLLISGIPPTPLLTLLFDEFYIGLLLYLEVNLLPVSLIVFLSTSPVLLLTLHQRILKDQPMNYVTLLFNGT